MKNLPVYKHPAAYAREHDELAAYRASNQANTACKEAIEAAIRDHYRDNRLDAAAVDQVVQQFGYHCIFCVSSPASRYTCFPARCWSLGCPGGDNLTRIASWRTRRMARRKRNVSDLPYAAPPLSCAAFFVKVQNGFAAASAAERKRGREKASRRRCGLFLCLKGEDSHHQFCLQPFPNVVVYAEIDIPALVVQLPHGEAGYVAAEMLQDNLHSVRVALCRYHNDRIGNKGIFRVAGFVTIRPIHQHFPPDIFLISQKSLSACTVSCFSTY